MNEPPGDLEARLASKEREWKELQTLRVQQLEGALSEAQEQLSSSRYQQGRHQGFWAP